MSRTILSNLRGPQGERGMQGLPGLDAVPTDEGLAAYVSSESETRDALDARFAASNVKTYGAKGDGFTDDTAALRAAAAASSHLYFPPGDYVVSSIAPNEALMTFADMTGVTIDASQARIINPTSYASQTITPLIDLDNCSNSTILVGEYVGAEVPDPHAHLGYHGSSFLRVMNGSQGLRVVAKVTHARYGVVSGSYETPTDGYCKSLDITLDTKFCGYPMALYLAEGVKFDVVAEDVHRAVYLAGCEDVTGVAKWKNIYVAPTALLITDALIAGSDVAAQANPVANPTSSRGCSNLDVTSIDMGSTVFLPNTHCAGISPSRVDPATYRNIKVTVGVRGDDTKSTQVHGFSIASTARSTWSRYPFNWEPHLVLENISVSGTVDKSAATASTGTGGALLIRTFDTDASHAATLRGLTVDGYAVVSGSTLYEPIRFDVKGMASPAIIRSLDAPRERVIVDGPANVPVVFEGSKIHTVEVSSVSANSNVIVGPGTVVTASIVGNSDNVEVSGGKVSTGGMKLPVSTGRGSLKVVAGVLRYQSADDPLFREIPSALRSPTYLNVTGLAIAANARSTATVTLADVASGDHVVVTPAAALPDGVIIAYSRVSAANTVAITFANLTGSAVSLTVAVQVAAFKRYI